MPKDLGGAPEEYGIADLGKPGTKVGYEGMDEQNLEKPSSELPTGEKSDDKGSVTSGPKD
jgi:hypothetical protein